MSLLPPAKSRNVETGRLDWQGITIEVRYEAEWLVMEDPAICLAHLEITSIEPHRAPLPLTETGYKSYLVRPAEVAFFGGPECYVLNWLNFEAQDDAWKSRVNASKPLSLF